MTEQYKTALNSALVRLFEVFILQKNDFKHRRILQKIPQIRVTL